MPERMGTLPCTGCSPLVRPQFRLTAPMRWSVVLEPCAEVATALAPAVAVAGGKDAGAEESAATAPEDEAMTGAHSGSMPPSRMRLPPVKPGLMRFVAPAKSVLSKSANLANCSHRSSRVGLSEDLSVSSKASAVVPAPNLAPDLRRGSGSDANCD
mmetsp:Transcript_55900/g.126322  ORF Transcript_55900/g.126322 Transcript_55900/m.126322 type:complete len:156 (+) Transcript_55900:233-700(+)